MNIYHISEYVKGYFIKDTLSELKDNGFVENSIF